MKVLVIGATGTLGRQIVKTALSQNYQVFCLVRNLRKARFLSEWGADLIYGDLSRPETLPRAFIDIDIVIDAATLRPDEEFVGLREIELLGKLALVRCAQIAQVKKYIFFSFLCDEDLSVPLLRVKKKVEKVIASSNLNFTIFQVSGFYQGLIAQYAIPILEQQSIWLTDERLSVNYVNTQDVARICIKSLAAISLKCSTLPIVNKKTWLSNDIIDVCEQLSGLQAKIQRVPIFFLKLTSLIFSLSKWGWSIQDRLAFSAVLANSGNSNNDLLFENLCHEMDLKDSDFLSLEDYLQEYFELMLIRLRDLNYDQSQAAKRKDLTF